METNQTTSHTLQSSSGLISTPPILRSAPKNTISSKRSRLWSCSRSRPNPLAGKRLTNTNLGASSTSPQQPTSMSPSRASMSSTDSGHKTSFLWSAYENFGSKLMQGTSLSSRPYPHFLCISSPLMSCFFYPWTRTRTHTLKTPFHLSVHKSKKTKGPQPLVRLGSVVLCTVVSIWFDHFAAIESSLLFCNAFSPCLPSTLRLERDANTQTEREKETERKKRRSFTARLCFAHAPLVSVWATSPQKQKQNINRTTTFFPDPLCHVFNSDWYDELSCIEAYDDSTSLMYMVMKGTMSSRYDNLLHQEIKIERCFNS